MFRIRRREHERLGGRWGLGILGPVHLTFSLAKPHMSLRALTCESLATVTPDPVHDIVSLHMI